MSGITRSVTGLAVAGSWLTGEMDEYSDLDLGDSRDKRKGRG